MHKNRALSRLESKQQNMSGFCAQCCIHICVHCTKARHIPMHPLQPYQFKFLCGDSFFIIIYFFFFRPLGISLHYFPVRALYPEPRTRPYEICIYLHCSALRALTAGRFRPTRPPTVVGKVCLVTSSESDLSPLDIVCTP